MKRVILVVGLLLLAAATAQADGRAKIWLDIPGSTYIDENSDPWLSESDLFAGSEGAFNFDLDAINKLKNGTIYDSHLVLAIPNDAPNSSWSIDTVRRKIRMKPRTGKIGVMKDRTVDIYRPA